MEENSKFVNFLYVNKKKIGAVITAAALVVGIACTAKSCSNEQYDAEQVDGIEYFDDSFKMPNVQLGDNSKENTDEIIEFEDVNKRNSLLNNKLGYVNGNVFGGTRPWGNTGGNKPSEPSKPVEPEKPQHVHSLVNRYEAHDENETCVVTRWQVCTASNCPNAGTRFNQTTTRSSHQYTPIAEIEDPVGSGIWIITDMCTVCNHTQERSSRYSLSGYSMNSEVFEKRATEKQKTLKLY